MITIAKKKAQPKGFMIYFDKIGYFEFLNGEECKHTLLALSDYAENGIFPSDLNENEFRVFKYLQKNIDADTSKYIETCHNRQLAKVNEYRKKNNLPAFESYEQMITFDNNCEQMSTFENNESNNFSIVTNLNKPNQTESNLIKPNIYKSNSYKTESEIIEDSKKMKSINDLSFLGI